MYYLALYNTVQKYIALAFMMSGNKSTLLQYLQFLGKQALMFVKHTMWWWYDLKSLHKAVGNEKLPKQ